MTMITVTRKLALLSVLPLPLVQTFTFTPSSSHYSLSRDSIPISTVSKHRQGYRDIIHVHQFPPPSRRSKTTFLTSQQSLDQNSDEFSLDSSLQATPQYLNQHQTQYERNKDVKGAINVKNQKDDDDFITMKELFSTYVLPTAESFTFYPNTNTQKVDYQKLISIGNDDFRSTASGSTQYNNITNGQPTQQNSNDSLDNININDNINHIKASTIDTIETVNEESNQSHDPNEYGNIIHKSNSATNTQSLTQLSSDSRVENGLINSDTNAATLLDTETISKYYNITHDINSDDTNNKTKSMKASITQSISDEIDSKGTSPRDKDRNRDIEAETKTESEIETETISIRGNEGIKSDNDLNISNADSLRNNDLIDITRNEDNSNIVLEDNYNQRFKEALQKQSESKDIDMSINRDKDTQQINLSKISVVTGTVNEKVDSEQDNVATKNKLMLAKDEEIAKLLKIKQEKELELTRLKFTLGELKANFLDSDSKLIDSEKQLQRIQQQNVKDALTSKQNIIDLQNIKSQLEEKSVVLESKVTSLQISLDHTLTKLQKSKTELQRLQQQSKKQINTLKEKQQSEMNSMKLAKDNELANLVKLKEEKETEIARLKFQINELKATISDYDSKLISSEKQLKLLQKQTKEKDLESQKEIKELTAQLRIEKDTLSQQKVSLTNELSKSKQESDKQVQQLKTQLEQQSTLLQSQIDELQPSLDLTKIQLERAQNESKELQQQSQQQISRLKDQHEKSKKYLTSVFKQEKKILQQQIYSLETKVSSADYNLIQALKQVKELSKSNDNISKQLETNQKLYEEELGEVEQRLLAEEMFYAKSKADLQSRMVRLVTKLQTRLQRRQLQSQNELNRTVESLQREKEIAVQQKQDEITLLVQESEIEKENYNAMIQEMNQRLKDANKQRMIELKNQENQLNQKLVDTTLSLAKENELRINEKDAEIKTIRGDARVAYRKLETEMMNKLVQAKEDKCVLKEYIKEQNDKIEEYERERKSLRKLLRLYLKLLRKRYEDLLSDKIVKMIGEEYDDYERERDSLRHLLRTYLKLFRQKSVNFINRGRSKKSEAKAPARKMR